MIPLIIKDKRYKLRNEWKEYSLREFKQINDFVYQYMPDYVQEALFNNKDLKLNLKQKQAYRKFQINFIHFVTDIPVDILKSTRVNTKDDELGVNDIFNVLSFLMFIPNEDIVKPTTFIDVNNERFYFIDNLDKLSVYPMKDSEFIDFTESEAIIHTFNELKEGRYDRLNFLIAIFYRKKKRTTIKRWFRPNKELVEVEPYDYDVMEERARMFQNVTMDIVWGVLFFFMQSRVSFLTSIKESSEAQQVREALKS